MDRLLILGRQCVEERNLLQEKILQLVDIYYDALDAPKKGLKVCYLLLVSFFQTDKFMVLVSGFKEAASWFNKFLRYTLGYHAISNNNFPTLLKNNLGTK